MTRFIDRLAEVSQTRTRVCVGIDPSDALLRAWGLPDDVDGLEQFCATCVEAFADLAGVVKPQMAWFERFGSAGVAVLEQTMAALSAAGALVVLDAKRGDIGHSNQGYASWLSTSQPWRADALTVHAYLGVDALASLFEAAARTGGYLFVVAHSSNPEGRVLQTARTGEGVTVGDHVIDRVNADPDQVAGVVIGATLADAGACGQRLEAGRLILAPGIGAQGADLATAAARFGDRWSATLPSVSRAILGEGPDVAALRTAVRDLQDRWWATLPSS